MNKLCVKQPPRPCIFSTWALCAASLYRPDRYARFASWALTRNLAAARVSSAPVHPSVHLASDVLHDFLILAVMHILPSVLPIYVHTLGLQDS